MEEKLDDHSLLNDLREFYFSGSVGQNAYIDIGRVNLKNGVAVGYNPTDYFKKRRREPPVVRTGPEADFEKSASAL